jgi:hypothetical protein
MKALPALLWLVLLASSLPAQDRFALVIGNRHDPTADKIEDSVAEATAMAETLQSLHFKVEILKNATLREMRNAVNSLAVNLQKFPDSCGFFYFAGDGVQTKKGNYLIPADAGIGSEDAVDGRAFAVQELLDLLQLTENALNVVVLDACRAKPFGGELETKKGLAAIINQPRNSIVAFAASADSTVWDGQGPQSLFSSQLRKNLSIPRLEIKGVFNKTMNEVANASGNAQVPAIYTRLVKDIYWLGTADSDSSPTGGNVQSTSNDKIGTLGPGGGIIFFNKGNSDGGWQYMEAAPDDLPVIPWFNGKDGVGTGAAGTAIGTGKSNTSKIIATLGQGHYAASACAAYSAGGFQDWFLPSKDELALVFKVIKTSWVFGSLSDFYYWSSSENSLGEAWVQDFRKGGQYYNLKGFPHLVRPVRSF